MTVFTIPAADVFAPVDSAGHPRGAVMGQAQTWAVEVERMLSAFQAGGGIIFQSKAQADAALAHGANQMAWVLGDATPGNNGVYQKTGASGAGAWVRRGDLPYSHNRLFDAGAGTANAVQLTSPLPTSASQIRVANVFEANAGNVTISENGAAAKPLLTASGQQIAPAGLSAGMMIVYVDAGGSFRLLSDQASAAVLAGAEATANRAEAARDIALGAAETLYVPTLAAGLAATIPAGIARVITLNLEADDGIKRVWVYSATDPGGPLGIRKFKSANNRWFKSTAPIVTVLAVGQSNGEGKVYTWAPRANLWSYDMRSPLIAGLPLPAGWERSDSRWISAPLATYNAVAKANPDKDYFVINNCWGGFGIDRWIGLPYIWKAAVAVGAGYISAIGDTALYIHEKDSTDTLRLNSATLIVVPTAIRITKSGDSSVFRHYHVHSPIVIGGTRVGEATITLRSSGGTLNDGDVVNVIFEPNNLDRINSEVKPALTALGRSRAEELWFWQGESNAADSPQYNYPGYYNNLMSLLVDGAAVLEPNAPALIFGVKDARPTGTDPCAGFNRQLWEVVRRAPTYRQFVDTCAMLPSASFWDGSGGSGPHPTAQGYDLLGHAAGRQMLFGKGLSTPLNATPFLYTTAGGADITGIGVGNSPVTLGTIVTDTHGFYTTVTGMGIYLPRMPGLYRVDLQMHSIGAAYAYGGMALIYKNGSIVAYGTRQQESAFEVVEATSAATFIADMNGVSDYLSIGISMGTGWSTIKGAPQQTRLQIVYLGPRAPSFGPA